VKILLDTQCWLWLQSTPERLSERVRDRLADEENALFLSAASAWEIAIKYALGKLSLPRVPAQYVPSRMQRSGTASLPLTHEHALRVATLPPHHRDPFDRLLVAQAQLEGMALLTADPQLSRYDVKLLAP
jgi:PIN domain nuclease of toxin-antitoxin system